MKRSLLNLAMANQELRGKLSQPSRDFDADEARWALAQDVRAEHDRLFGTVAFPYSVAEVCDMHRNLRKTPLKQTLAEVALKHGPKCIFAGRGRGECCDELFCSSFVPGSEVTPATAFIECKCHRKDRAGRSVSEYLASIAPVSSSPEVPEQDAYRVRKQDRELPQ